MQLGSRRYAFLVDSYETEILKVLSVWSMFGDGDLPVRPHPTDTRGRSVLEHMVHQSVSENLWFERMLGISVTSHPLPKEETRIAFIELYADNARRRLEQLRTKPDLWWEESTAFFEVFPGLGPHSAHRPHGPSPRPADGATAHAPTRPPQHLRPDRGHGGVDAGPRAGRLRVRQPGRAAGTGAR